MTAFKELIETAAVCVAAAEQLYLGEDRADNDLDISTILEKVFNERLRQREKWGKQNHDIYKWIAIAAEELGEVSEAALNGRIK